MDLNEEMMREVFENMSPEMKESMATISALARDRMCSTNDARRHFREIAATNPEALHVFDRMCLDYDLNKMVVQSLGNIKAMLEKFDENDFSSVKIKENVMLHKHISQVLFLSMRNIDQQIQEINKHHKEEEANETGDGDSSG